MEQGQAVDMITERIEKRKREKEDLQTQLAIEMNKQLVFTAPQIRAFMSFLGCYLFLFRIRNNCGDLYWEGHQNP